jgi:dTDP-4-dehydrorhamnose 3,5-epimerase
MYVSQNDISGLELHKFTTHSDFRGTFSRFPPKFYEDLENESYFATALNIDAFTLRGLHSQTKESPETKRVFCITGRIYDVVVDLREDSKTFGNWTSITLGPMELVNGIKVPAGCAHGYLTLDANTAVLYRIDGRYAPKFAFNIKWDDPIFSIDWPVKPIKISNQDISINYLTESQFQKEK